MNFKEMLNLADKIVFAKTGQHLNDLQEAILRGTIQRETYKEMAKEFNCSESRIREIGSQLWEILSEELGENVSKSNLRSTMGRFIFSNVSNLENVSNFGFEKEVIAISSFNTCGESNHSPDIPNSHRDNEETTNSKQTKTSYQDLSEMPELGAFYNRTPEFDTLKTWILQQRCRLIALTGISGIGKTALAVQLVEQIKDEFEYVIWFNLDESYTLDELQHKLIEFLLQSENIDSPATNQKHLPLIKYLQKYRCLVVLDDIHNLFSSGDFAGKYKPGYEEYRTLFKQIETLSHQSCFLIIGWEQPREIPQVKSENIPIRTLQIKGLNIAAAREILRNYGLAEIDNCEAIIHRYQGNPLWLKSVGNFVQELGEGAIELLLSNTIFLPEDLKYILQQQFNRLSEIEKQVIYLLAEESEPINLAKLLEKGRIPSSDLLNALQSLSRRCSIEQQGNFYILPSVLRQYIKGL